MIIYFFAIILLIKFSAFALVAILFFYEAHSASSVSSHFGIPEREKFKNVFADAMLSTDVAQMYYAIEGYRLLNEVPASTKESCKVSVFDGNYK